jgi:DNA processing protein
MLVNKLTVIPRPLQQIPQPPTQLFHAGVALDDLLPKPCIAIVGSRRASTYGRQVTAQIAGELAALGCIIVSGLAYGVDTIAHEAALRAGGRAIAVLPSPIETIVPASNRRLAERIVTQGGALVSEYPEGTVPHKLHFVERNRLMAGLSRAVLITEAAKKSGSLHTAQFALEQGKDVLAVPGNLTSALSEGTNQLIQSGAALISGSRDVLELLGMPSSVNPKQRSIVPTEQLLLDLLYAENHTHEHLLTKSQLTIQEFSQSMAQLEISGKIMPQGAGTWLPNQS